MPNSIELTGCKKLKEAVERDCNDRNSCGCFNPEGCNVPRRSKDGKFCSHDYCDKFKWVIDRAKQYGEKLGLNWEDVLESWESGRSYWYMNYYQECNQPEINSDKVKVFESVDEMLKNIGEKQFRCPTCGGISTSPYKCNTGLEMSKGKICDWNVGGLFGDLGRGIFVYCKDKLAGQTIFMPVAWENAEKEVKLMPGCYKCGTQQKILISLTTTLPDTKGKPQIGSYALCDQCAEDHKEDAKK